MQNEWNPPPLAGQPMDISELLDEMALLALPDGSRVVTIEEARNELPLAKKILISTYKVKVKRVSHPIDILNYYKMVQKRAA